MCIVCDAEELMAYTTPGTKTQYQWTVRNMTRNFMKGYNLKPSIILFCAACVLITDNTQQDGLVNATDLEVLTRTDCSLPSVYDPFPESATSNNNVVVAVLENPNETQLGNPLGQANQILVNLLWLLQRERQGTGH